MPGSLGQSNEPYGSITIDHQWLKEGCTVSLINPGSLYAFMAWRINTEFLCPSPIHIVIIQHFVP
jgi:hypothetical protein